MISLVSGTTQKNLMSSSTQILGSNLYTKSQIATPWMEIETIWWLISTSDWTTKRPSTLERISRWSTFWKIRVVCRKLLPSWPWFSWSLLYLRLMIFECFITTFTMLTRSSSTKIKNSWKQNAVRPNGISFSTWYQQNFNVAIQKENMLSKTQKKMRLLTISTSKLNQPKTLKKYQQQC